MSSTTPDGSLLSWSEVADLHEWAVLLLGNGLSINVWSRFDYGSLFDKAQDKWLTDEDRALFDGTPNFERALGDIGTAIRVNEVVNNPTKKLLQRYQNIQLALGQAVKAVHINKTSISDEALATIRAEMLKFQWVFTTSYDLIVYWAMGHGGYKPFVDCFRWNNRCQFDTTRAEVGTNDHPVYFLHGGLHLVTSPSEVTWKVRAKGLRSILDQFGKPIDGDPQARPLLVTEGSSRDKLRAIEGNDYLTHSLDRLRQSQDLPLVIFGSSLGKQDAHLVEALSENPQRPVAVSMRRAPRKETAAKQINIYERLEVDPLYFFDAETHPLGSSKLAATPSWAWANSSG